MSLHLPLHLEARRRRQTPAFGRLSRAAAVALASRSLDPLLPAVLEESADDAVFFARIHGISGLLDSLADARVPATVAEAWRADRARVGARAARFRDDLDRLRRRASEAGLAFHPLKGALLAFGMYPDPSLRPAADIDLLAEEPDFEGWSRILVEEGYFAQTESPDVRVFFRTDFRTPDSFEEHPDNPRPVELHFRLGEGFRGLDLTLEPEAGATWRPAPEQGLRLRPEAALAQLAAHTSVNLLERRLRLIQLLDLLLLGAQLDGAAWSWLVGTGGSPHGARFLWPSLALADRIAPGRLPAGTLEALRQACPPALVRWLGEQSLDALLWHGGPGARRALLELPRIWPIGWREQLRYWQTVLLPEPARLADRYPDLAERGRVDLMLLRHVQYNLRQFRRRLAQRP